MPHFVRTRRRRTVFTKNADNIQLFDKIWSKQNCLLYMKLGTYIDLNMLNLIAKFI